jgi:hypothetical protein
MKMTLRIVGTLLVVFGAIWMLQGINVLPGTFMVGKTEWVVYGGIAFAAGLVLSVLAGRMGKQPAGKQE